jgi:GTP diphosphokinase / guanosine-3',5'-bis(diphosphate) 3'-diphosphatase
VIPDINQALRYAAQRHAGQTRADRQTPYIRHPECVVAVLRRHGYADPHLLVAAAVHDLVEDTQTTREDLAQQFGERVAAIVAEVTDPDGLSFDERRRLQLLRIVEASREAQALKLADRICNLGDAIRARPPHWTDERFALYVDAARSMAMLVREDHPGLAQGLLDLVAHART